MGNDEEMRFNVTAVIGLLELVSTCRRKKLVSLGEAL
jgi:hypothetical protein